MRIVGRAAEDATAVRGRSEAVSEDKVGSPESLGLGGSRLELREREVGTIELGRGRHGVCKPEILQFYLKIINMAYFFHRYLMQRIGNVRSECLRI